MIGVFDIIEGPARGKRFWLRDNQQMAVGRISTADFSVPSDSHMSRHHLIFEANLDVIRVRDVGSANGTFVNNARIKNLELCAGDKIRAGTTTFELSILKDGEDPHKDDGIAFTRTRSNSTAMAARQVAVSTRIIQDPDEKLDYASATQVESQPTDDAATMRLHSVWWTPFFDATVDSKCLVLRDAATENFGQVLKELANSFEIVIVVNQSQLMPLAAMDFQTLIRTENVKRLSQTLYVVPFRPSPEFESFNRNARRSDAIIYLGSDAPIQSLWLTKFADILSYPSMLSSLVGTDHLQRLLTKVGFVIYEKDRNGTINMLLGGP